MAIEGVEVYYDNGGRVERPIRTGDDALETFNEIPQIDVSDMYSDDLAKRKALAEKIGTAARTVGFYYAMNTGVDTTIMDDAFAAVKGFFALPMEVKMRQHINNIASARGYETYGETGQDVSLGQVQDFKESFVIGEDPTEPEQQHTYTPAEGDVALNQWPDLPGFRPRVQAYYRACFDFAMKLLKIYALALGLEEDGLDHLFKAPIVGQNSIHYPPFPAGAVSTKPQLGAHADHSAFSMVLQEGVPALEILNANGIWIKAPPLRHCFVINVGDYLQNATNGTFKSTIHRVLNTTSDERYSLPFFLSPDPNAVISPLPQFVPEGEQPKYAAVEIGRMNVVRCFRVKHTHPSSVALREKGIGESAYHYKMLQGIKA